MFNRKGLSWKDITSASDMLLQDWLAIYERSFPFEVLMPPESIVALVQQADAITPNIPHINAVLADGKVVGGALVWFLHAENVGFGSYIFVDQSWRGQGIGRFAYEQAMKSLKSDSVARGAAPLNGLLTEVEREDLAQDEADRQHRVARLRLFGQWGARILHGLDYLQPPLHTDEHPLPMYLMFHAVSIDTNAIPSRTLLSWVRSIYTVIYSSAADLPDSVSQACFSHVVRSLKAESVTLRLLD